MKRVQYGLSAFMLVIATIIGNVAFSNQASALAGEGDDENPWLITNCADIQALNSSSTYNNDSFVLTQNIDCNGVNFTRLMFATDQEFKGTFDGAGHKISNVAVNNSVDRKNGFFGSLDRATIKDLTLENVTVSGEAMVGALAGSAEGTSYIENVNVIGGTVTAVGDDIEDGFGGLIGSIEDTQVFNVIVDVDVVATSAYYVGGLVGYVTSSTLGQVAALGNVEGNEGVGGLIGYAGNGSEFDKSFATGNVIAHAGPGGGLAGQSYDTNFIGTYARGNVTGSGYVGGHSGILGAGSLIGWAYATGVVTPQGESIGGGLIGFNDDAATVQADTFWDIETSGMETSASGIEVGKTTAEMKDINTYVPFDWNFEDYWFQADGVNDGYLCQIWYQVCYDAFTGNPGGSSDLPNNGDGNNDGTIDEDQDNVVTLLSPVSNKYVTVAVDDTCVLSDVSIAGASGHASQDTGFDYKSGFVSFTATGCAQDVANVKLYYHGVTPGNVIARKYNPTTNTYHTIVGASIAAASAPLSGTVVSYAVVDNSELDIDPADGVIVDPVGLATVPSVPNTGVERRASVLLVIPLFAISIVTLVALIWYIRKKNYSV